MRREAVRAIAIAWLALLILLSLSAGSALLPLGRFNLVVSLVIAAMKALIVMAVFMRLREHRSLNWVLAGAGFLWLAVLLFLGGIDYVTRAPLVVPA
jgi:cytochrome c oxidase subunit 4